MAITKKQRKECEELIYKYFDTLDKSKSNGDYYRTLIGSMSDAQFEKFIARKFPFRFHYKSSVTEPTMSDIKKSLDVLGVPLLEEITLPYLYKNKNGDAVTTKKCFVGYFPHKKVQQIVTKKSKWGTDIANRDGKTGRLIGGDKGASTSDREFEAFATMGLNNVMKEFYGPKADAMESKNAMYSEISTTGMFRLSDLPNEVDDSLSKNMFNSYLIASHINSNLINQGDYTMKTIRDKNSKGIERDI